MVAIQGDYSPWKASNEARNRYTLLKMAVTTNVSLLGYVSKIVSILLSKLRDCANTDTWLCCCNYPF